MFYDMDLDSRSKRENICVLVKHKVFLRKLLNAGTMIYVENAIFTSEQK